MASPPSLMNVSSQLDFPPPTEVPIHGDCHPQQFLVAGTDIALLDLDSAALGHPNAYDQFQRNLCDHYCVLPHGSQAAVEAYTSLTLARHIFLSTQFTDRLATTELILEHFEHLLALQDS